MFGEVLVWIGAIVAGLFRAGVTGGGLRQRHDGETRGAPIMPNHGQSPVGPWPNHRPSRAKPAANGVRILVAEECDVGTDGIGLDAAAPPLSVDIWGIERSRPNLSWEPAEKRPRTSWQRNHCP
jgi:hypothetical protein